MANCNEQAGLSISASFLKTILAGDDMDINFYSQDQTPLPPYFQPPFSHLECRTPLEWIVDLSLLITPAAGNLWVAHEHSTISVIIEAWVKVQCQVIFITAQVDLEPGYGKSRNPNTCLSNMNWFHTYSIPKQNPSLVRPLLFRAIICETGRFIFMQKINLWVPLCDINTQKNS